MARKYLLVCTAELIAGGNNMLADSMFKSGYVVFDQIFARRNLIDLAVIVPRGQSSVSVWFGENHCQMPDIAVWFGEGVVDLAIERWGGQRSRVLLMGDSLAASATENLQCMVFGDERHFFREYCVQVFGWKNFAVVLQNHMILEALVAGKSVKHIIEKWNNISV